MVTNRKCCICDSIELTDTAFVCATNTSDLTARWQLRQEELDTTHQANEMLASAKRTLRQCGTLGTQHFLGATWRREQCRDCGDAAADDSPGPRSRACGRQDGWLEVHARTPPTALQQCRHQRSDQRVEAGDSNLLQRSVCCTAASDITATNVVPWTICQVHACSDVASVRSASDFFFISTGRPSA